MKKSSYLIFLKDENLALNKISGEILKTKMPKQKSKDSTIMLNYIFLSKIFSAYGVVILHTNGNGVFWHFKNHYEKYKYYLISSNLIECIFYYSVPFFVLCIGATLLDFNEKYGLKIYYIRRIKKVIIPFLIWNIILYLFRTYLLRDMKKIKINFINIWNLYYGHKIYSIFNSIHIFILMYMIIPLIAYVRKENKITIYSYSFIILFLIQTLIPYLISIFRLNLIWVYQIHAGYIIYIFAGYIIEHYKFLFSIKLIIYLFGIFGLLLHIFGTQILILRYKKTIEIHKGYLNLPCILYSCALFLFIKEFNILFSKKIYIEFINKIGTLTMGSFYMHFPMMKIYIKNFKINKLGLKYRLFGGIIICSLCLILTALMKKIPIIKYVVP